MVRETSISRVCTLSLVLLTVLFTTINGQGEKDNDLAYQNILGEQQCQAQCRGIHDVGCQQYDRGYACKCQGGYYSSHAQCKLECRHDQFWSLFTYAECSKNGIAAALTGGAGLCQEYCVFRVRLWATILTIALFASSLLLLLLMLPGCITSCYTCSFLRKQKRRAKEEAEAAGGSGTLGKGGYDPQAAAYGAYGGGGGYPAPFYGGWPSYGGGR